MRLLTNILAGLIFISFSFSIQAQMMTNPSGELVMDHPYFNPDFIKRNKVKSISGYFSNKKELDIIRPTTDIYGYEFNSIGQLTQMYKTQFNDTIVTLYDYNPNGLVTHIRKSDKNGFYSYVYEYDSLNRIISKEYRRDLNKTGNRLNFELDKSYSISKETYTYEQTTIGLKKQYYNSRDKLYQTEFILTDSNGYLIQTESHLVTGSGHSKVNYIYGDKGLLIQKTSDTYLTKRTTTELLFEYDENENLLAQHYYRDGEYITEFQILYNHETMLLKAILSRDVATNYIQILKFTDIQFY